MIIIKKIKERSDSINKRIIYCFFIDIDSKLFSERSLSAVFFILHIMFCYAREGSKWPL